MPQIKPGSAGPDPQTPFQPTPGVPSIAEWRQDPAGGFVPPNVVERHRHSAADIFDGAGGGTTGVGSFDDLAVLYWIIVSP